MIYLLIVLSERLPSSLGFDFLCMSRNKPVTRRKWKINYCSLFLDFVPSELKSDLMRFNIYIAVYTHPRLIAILETSITADTWSMTATIEQVNNGKLL